MIALQVAAGIILAYVIIVNQRKLLAVGGWLLGALATLAAIGAIIWAGVAAVQFAGSSIPSKAWQTLWTFACIIPVFILAFTAELGMLMLVSLLVGKGHAALPGRLFDVLGSQDGKDDSGTGCIFAFFLVGAVMLAINYAISFPVWAYTPIGGWYDAIDAYGRANGWDDGLSLLFGALLWQWAWVPLGVYFGFRRLWGSDASCDRHKQSEGEEADEFRRAE